MPFLVACRSPLELALESRLSEHRALVARRAQPPAALSIDRASTYTLTADRPHGGASTGLGSGGPASGHALGDGPDRRPLTGGRVLDDLPSGGSPRDRASTREGRPGQDDTGLRDASLDDAADGLLGVIERLEVEKARLEGRIVDAYAALHTVQEQQLARLVTKAPVPLTAEQVVAQEVGCATGVGAGEVSRRLELALAPRRHRVLREALRRGGVSLYRALQVVAETRALDEEVLPELEAAVLAPAPDGSVASQRLFATRLRRCVRSADARGEPERRCSAARGRTAYGRLTEDGMGVFTVVAAAERVVGVLDRADAIARAARAAGDARTLDQLRSDVLCDLALFGTIPPGSAPDAASTAALGAASTAALGAASTAALGAASTAALGAASMAGAEAHAAGGLLPMCGGLLAAAPPAVVRIVVPFEVAAGISDAACEIPGHGWVTAAHARRIMTAPGSLWQRLAVEADTGRALELSTDRYRPTAAMVAHVRAVDGVCRAPGCQVPAERCDLDHVVPWPRGQTRVSNLESLSRGCHHPKTAGAWTVTPVADDGLRWTSLAGRDYVTYPKDWREALHDPGSHPPDDAASRHGPSRSDPPNDPPPF